MVELKPCPACGCAVLKHYYKAMVSCSNNDCLLSGPIHDLDGAKWNAIPRHDETVGIPRPQDDSEIVKMAVANAEMLVANLGAERPPMSRERFRQEAVLAYIATHSHIAFIDISRWGDELTAAVFGDEV